MLQYFVEVQTVLFSFLFLVCDSLLCGYTVNHFLFYGYSLCPQDFTGINRAAVASVPITRGFLQSVRQIEHEAEPGRFV